MQVGESQKLNRFQIQKNNLTKEKGSFSGLWGSSAKKLYY